MQVMQELGLIGLRIQRMPSEPGLEFDIPSKYGYMTVYPIRLYIDPVLFFVTLECVGILTFCSDASFRIPQRSISFRELEFQKAAPFI